MKSMKVNRTFFLNLALVSGLAHAAENLPEALTNTEALPPVNTLVVPAPVTPAPKATGEFAEKLVAGIRHQLAQKMNRDESEFQVSLENLVTVPAYTGKIIGAIQILGMGSTGSNRPEGYFNVNALVPTALGNVELKVMGVLKVTGPVVIAKSILPRDHRISSDDIQVVKLPWRTLSSGIPGMGEAEFVGQRVKTLISAGAPIHPQNLEDPLDVQSGDMVELLIQSGPGVMIRSRAFAKQEGRIGDTIRIEQPDTKKKMSAVVRGPKSVEVQL
jgi:flagella basal body P-ring formation protein FlgA